MTRFIPRKSLLVLGVLAAVLGAPVAAAAAVHPAGTPSTAGVRPASTAAVRPAAVRPAAVHQAVTTAYPAAASATALSSPNLLPASGLCTVPGIGDIGSLVGLCSAGQSGLVGDLNNICQPSLPQPEPANGGIDSIIRPPAATDTPQNKTLYDNYGVAGQFWGATDLQCSDMTSLIGNNVAGMVFDAAKAVDRLTITVYQSAAGNGILSWLRNVVDRLITGLGNAIYFPYLAPVVLLGVMWLAWHGLIRKRATRTIEGTIWMVVACAAAIWLIGRPGDFTGVGQSVSNGVTQVLNVAFSKLPNPGGSNCVPVQSGDPQSPGANFGFTAGNGLVDQNANELWAVLVCKPWLDGEFGTTQYSTGAAGHTLVNKYGRQLLWAQAVAANEKPTTGLIKAKQAVYSGIAAGIKANDPTVYPLFQGNQWTSRLEVGFAALFAALVAGVLVLLIAITLIILKLGFLLLLVAGPFFLIVGTHPGFGRVVAVRWVEMIIGVLLKQVAVALVLSILLYAYSLIMGTTDAVLPWALKILMIALVTVAVFIYRKPFQHLFSAVGYGSVGARERAEIEMYRSREVLRRNATGTAAAAAGFTGYRVGRWSRRDPVQSATLAEHIALASGANAGNAADVAAGQAAMAGGQNGSADANGQQSGEAGNGQLAGAGARSGPGTGRAWAAAGVDGSRRFAPPLHLPSRVARSGDEVAAAPSGWARSGSAEGTAAGRPRGRPGDVPPRPVIPRPARSASGPPRAAQPRQAGPAASAPASAPASGPPARVAAGGGGVLPGGTGSRSRWRGEAPARRDSGGRGGRPLWEPGPIRPSTGWSGSGSRPASPPPASPGASRQAAPPAAAAPPAYPYSGTGAAQSRPRQRSGGSPPAGQRGGQSGGQGENGGSAPPTPFWLRPVRRKK